MKKILKITYIVFCIVFLKTGTAQFYIGMKGGMNFPTAMEVSDIVEEASSKDFKLDTDGSRGFHIGIWCRVKIPHILGIRPELVYTQTDYKYNGTTLTAKSVDMPILLEKKLLKYFNLHLGPLYPIPYRRKF